MTTNPKFILKKTIICSTLKTQIKILKAVYSMFLNINFKILFHKTLKPTTYSIKFLKTQ